MINLRVLVTGGAGFLGSNLCDELINQGHQVTCLDNLITGRIRNIEQLMNNNNFKFIQEDVCSFKTNEEYDWIFHMASPASPIHYQKNSLLTLDSNTIGTKNMLELARKCSARMVYASTSEVYGDAKVVPSPETYWGNVNSYGPRSCYDEAKRCGEAYCYEYFNKDKVDIRIVRIFNTYGPRLAVNDGRVVGSFIMQCLENKPITIFGEGRQTRSFCYVSDLIKGLMLLMQKDNLSGEVINLGNPNEMSLAEFAIVVKRITKSNSEIIFKKLPKDDPQRRKPDITKAREILGWKPETDLNDGLTKTIEYFKRLKQ